MPVKWLNGPFSIITILDPNDPIYARARIEPWLILVESENWSNYLIYKKDNNEAYATVLDAFNAMWNHPEWTMEAPRGVALEEFAKTKLGLGTLGSLPESA